jgi:phosphoglycolate phosphatase
MAQEQLRKVFCDFDGTLVDVSERNHIVYKNAVEVFGGQALPKDEYWDLKRKKTKWPALLPLSGIDPGLESSFLDEFISRVESEEYLRIDKPFPGALETIADLSKNNECYLVSLRRNDENLRAQLGWLGLAAYFTEILSGHSETDGYDKKIELIQDKLGSSKGVIIGDTEADIVTGQTLGMLTIGLTSGIRDRQFLQKLEPDYLLGSITEVSGLKF